VTLASYSDPDRRLLTAWSLDCAEHVLPLFERMSADTRPRTALTVGADWLASGVFSMSTIRGASLGAHAAAKLLPANSAGALAAHAAGQAIATAHVAQHAYGGAYYALRAVLADADAGDAAARLGDEHAWQEERLPDHLRKAIMARLRIAPRGRSFVVTLDKSPGF
jgi:hypothetical protein